MNKTITINLAGFNFYINESAYHQLDQYLKAIATSLHEDTREETLQDIEARIAELFLEKQQSDNQVIEQKDIERVIEIMGQPKDFAVDDDTDEDTAPQFNKTTKKLYRDVDKRLLGGVCSGLGYYFGISSVWIRLLFLLAIILSYSGFILIYIVLWIITPAARTTAERLEMRGEKINVNTIERQVREGFSKIKSNVQKGNYSGVERFFDTLKTILLKLGKGALQILGILLIIFSILGILGLISSILGVGVFGFIQFPWIDYVSAADLGLPFWAVTILLILTLIIPLIVVLYLGIALCTPRFKSPNLGVKIAVFALWIISLFIIAGLGIRQATLRTYDIDLSEQKTLPIQAQDSLHLVPAKGQWGLHSGRFDSYFITTDAQGHKFILSDEVDIQLRPTSGKAYYTLTKSASGYSYQNAKSIAQKIHYPITLKGDSLFLPRFLTTDLANNLKFQEVDLTIYLPEDIHFTVSHQLDFHMRNLERSDYGKLLQFKDGKLTCSSCLDPKQEAADTSKWYTAPKAIDTI